MMSSIPTYVLGTEVKMRVDVTCPGFDAERDDFCIEVTNILMGYSATFDKVDLALDEEGHYYLLFDTADFGSGTLRARMTIDIPDEDYDDGLRRVVDVQTLCRIIHG